LIELLVVCYSRRVSTIYAIIEAGGKQHRVEQGKSIDIDLIDAREGSTVELDRVLFAGNGDKIAVGKPTIKDAKVTASVNKHGKSEKIIVFRYKNKTRYTNKLGHRQHFTNVTIDKIEVPELKPKSKTTRKTQEQKVEEKQDGA